MRLIADQFLLAVPCDYLRRPLDSDTEMSKLACVVPPGGTVKRFVPSLHSLGNCGPLEDDSSEAPGRALIVTVCSPSAAPGASGATNRSVKRPASSLRPTEPVVGGRRGPCSE